MNEKLLTNKTLCLNYDEERLKKFMMYVISYSKIKMNVFIPRKK